MHLSSSATLFLGLIFCFFPLSQSEPPPEWQGGGNYYTKVRNTGPSKIFEWLGSRISRFPSYLPKIPSFPKYSSSYKLPNYHVMIPDPPSHGGEDFYSEGNQKPYEGDDFPFGGHGHTNDDGPNDAPEEEYKGPQENEYSGPPAPNNNYAPPVNEYQPPNNYNAPPQPQQNHYNVPQQPQQNHYNVPPPNNNYATPPQQNQYAPPSITPPYKPKESPIEMIPSKMVAYNKETYPQAGGGGDWLNHNPSPSPAPPQQNYQPQQQYYQPQPPAQAVKNVPVTPQSTGPDYFNTAYYEGKAQVSQQPFSNFPPAQSYDTLGAALSSVQHGAGNNFINQQPEQSYAQPPQSYTGVSGHGQPASTFSHPQQNFAYDSPGKQDYNKAINGFDFNQQDLASLVTSSDQEGFGSFAQHGQNQFGQHTQPTPTYSQAPAQQIKLSQHNGKNYIEHSPGVKILQSQDSGNPVFEIIADANAPDYNGHPFDINKLISMIEPGAQLVDAQPSHQASEKKEVIAAPPSSTSGKTQHDSTNQGDLRLISTNINTTNAKLTNYPNNSSSFKDILNFFQRTHGKGFVVVEKKGPMTTDTDNLTNDLGKEELIGQERLNITANNFPLLFPQIPQHLNFFNVPHPPSTFFNSNSQSLSFPKPTTSNPSSSISNFGQNPPNSNFYDATFSQNTTKSSTFPKFFKIPNPPSTFTSTAPPFSLTTSIPLTKTTSIPPVVFFAVQKTTRHPNHNYKRKFPYVVRSRPAFEYGDLDFADSNIQSIAITVPSTPSTTPKPKSKSSTMNLALKYKTTERPIVVTTDRVVVPVTKKSVSSSSSRGGVSRPAPVYKHKKSTKKP